MTYLPALFGVLGLFVGRHYAHKYGECPHRGKVWGAFLLPLLLLIVMMDQAPLVFMVSAGAAMGAGLTAHRSIKVSLLATTVGVTIATEVAGFMA
jgi:hypothetical protein